MDVCISFDTTGSMYSCINQVKKNIKEVVNKIKASIPNIRLSIVSHGDYCDGIDLMNYLDFTVDTDAIISFINNSKMTNGGDYPEAYEYVLNKVQTLDWENNNKCLIMIGDAYPHKKNDNPHGLDWKHEVSELQKMGINIYSVQALYSGNAEWLQLLMDITCF